MADDMGTELTYRVSYTEALREVKDELSRANSKLTSLQEDVRRSLAENEDLRIRVRALELRFYGILAGVVAAIGALIYSGGGLNGS